jgi:hypothetical protein
MLIEECERAAATDDVGIQTGRVRPDRRTA